MNEYFCLNALINGLKFCGSRLLLTPSFSSFFAIVTISSCVAKKLYPLVSASFLAFSSGAGLAPSPRWGTSARNENRVKQPIILARTDNLIAQLLCTLSARNFPDRIHRLPWRECHPPRQLGEDRFPSMLMALKLWRRFLIALI